MPLLDDDEDEEEDEDEDEDEEGEEEDAPPEFAISFKPFPRFAASRVVTPLLLRRRTEEELSWCWCCC